MKYKLIELMSLIDFLSGRLGVDEKFYFEQRDQIISDAFDFIQNQELKKNERYK